MKRILLPALLAAALSASAHADGGAPRNLGIPHYGDENDLSWQYVPPSAKQWPADPAGVPKSPVRFGDENDLSWMYQPNAKPQFDTDIAGTPRQYVEFGDENNLTWLYQAPTAKFADPARQHPYVGFAPGSGSKGVPAGTVAGRKDN